MVINDTQTGLDVIRDNIGHYTIEQFCKMYNSIPTSLLVPTTFVLQPKLYDYTEDQITAYFTTFIHWVHPSCRNPLCRSETELVVTRMLSIAQHGHKDDKPQPAPVPSLTHTLNKPLIQLLDQHKQPVNVSHDIQLKELSEQAYEAGDFEEVKNHKVCNCYVGISSPWLTGI